MSTPRVLIVAAGIATDKPDLAGGDMRFLEIARHWIKLGVDVSVKKGGAQIEYTDQDPRVHRMFLEELKKNGVNCRMGEFLDERMLLGERV